jgi:hypothetical protein
LAQRFQPEGGPPIEEYGAAAPMVAASVRPQGGQNRHISFTLSMVDFFVHISCAHPLQSKAAGE